MTLRLSSTRFWLKKRARGPSLIGLQDHAAVDEVGHRQGIDVRGVRAAVVVEDQEAHAQAKLPQRVLVRLRAARAGRSRGCSPLRSRRSVSGSGGKRAYSRRFDLNQQILAADVGLQVDDLRLRAQRGGELALDDGQDPSGRRT